MITTPKRALVCRMPIERRGLDLLQGFRAILELRWLRRNGFRMGKSPWKTPLSHPRHPLLFYSAFFGHSAPLSVCLPCREVSTLPAAKVSGC